MAITRAKIDQFYIRRFTVFVFYEIDYLAARSFIGWIDGGQTKIAEAKYTISTKKNAKNTN
jgi:hypothetical protein